MTFKKINVEYAEWLHNLAPWTFAVTITFHRSRSGIAYSNMIMKDAIRHFLRILDRKSYGRKQIKAGKVVNSLVLIGGLGDKRSPHAHLSLVLPDGMKSVYFISLIKNAIYKTIWINREYDIKPYKDIGWTTYMLDHGTENLEPEFLRISPNK